MSEPQPLQAHTYELEARLLLSKEYDEDDIDDIMDIYRHVVKHIGFTDRRSDKRFVVKFHDIFYYAPEETTNDKDAHSCYDELFDRFCYNQYEFVLDAVEHSCALDLDGICTHLLKRQPVGHYKPFLVYIPEITQDNALEVARQIYDEGLDEDYVDEYVYTTTLLQDLEDNYMTYWIEFLRDNDYPECLVKATEERYNNDNNNRPQQPQPIN